jgi:plastocyanin domain-containing protein
MKSHNKNNIIIAIIISISIIIFAIILSGSKQNQNSSQEIPVNNVSIVDGVQIIKIQAKGGYSPSKSIAKAGIPTIIQFTTNGTFDCSSSIRIPSMNIFKSLSASGATNVDLGTQKVGNINGSCGMGMFPFEIQFS